MILISGLIKDRDILEIQDYLDPLSIDSLSCFRKIKFLSWMSMWNTLPASDFVRELANWSKYVRSIHIISVY